MYHIRNMYGLENLVNAILGCCFLFLVSVAYLVRSADPHFRQNSTQYVSLPHTDIDFAFFPSLLVAFFTGWFLGNRWKTDYDHEEKVHQEKKTSEIKQPTSTRTCNKEAKSIASQASSTKMVLLVRTDLGMTTGKIAAQCCHAAVGLVEAIVTEQNTARLKKVHFQWYKSWQRTACAKITLQVPHEHDLHSFADQAEEKGLPYYLVQDAGRTQIPTGSYTVLGIGPAPSEAINEISGELKLL